MTIKHFYIPALLLVFTTLNGYAQQIAINEDGSLPNPNAILDVKSFNKGILFPRMSTTNRLAIPNTKGLLVFDTTANSFWYNTGTAWLSLAQGSVIQTGWSLTGNSGLTLNNFIGTTDNSPLFIKVNNQLSGRIDAGITTSWGNTFLGYKAGLNTPLLPNPISSSLSSSNSGIGFGALEKNTTGSDNTAVGYSALWSNTISHGNVAVGSGALQLSTGGSSNVALGHGAMSQNIEGDFNVGIGMAAMSSNYTGNYNVAIGFNSFYSNNTGSENTTIGAGSLVANTSGYSNAAMGYRAMEFNSAGYQNTAAGSYALRRNITGKGNTAFGDAALLETKGSYNLGAGHIALWSNITGEYNTGLGPYTDVFASNLVNATAVGFGAIVNASNKVRIGNASVTVLEGPVPFSTPSDGRFKYEVQENVKGLDFVLQLRPVTYHFDTRLFDNQLQGNRPQPDSIEIPLVTDMLKESYQQASRIRRSGFIAQEVENAANNSGYEFSGLLKPASEQDYYSISYESFVVPLVKAVQELHAELAKLKQEKEHLVTDLQKQISELKQLLQHAK